MSYCCCSRHVLLKKKIRAFILSMNKLKQKKSKILLFTEKKTQNQNPKVLPLTLNHSRDDIIKAQALRWCFLQVESNWEWLDFFCLLGLRILSERSESIHFKRVIQRTDHFSSSPFFSLLITLCTQLLLPNHFKSPHILAGWLVPPAQKSSLFGWGARIHVTPAHWA